MCVAAYVKSGNTSGARICLYVNSSESKFMQLRKGRLAEREELLSGVLAMQTGPVTRLFLWLGFRTESCSQEQFSPLPDNVGVDFLQYMHTCMSAFEVGQRSWQHLHDSHWLEKTTSLCIALTLAKFASERVWMCGNYQGFPTRRICLGTQRLARALLTDEQC